MAEAKKGGREHRSFRPHRSKRKVCLFCADKKEKIDYKDVNLLRKFVAENGKILPRRMTGTDAYHQRKISVAIKRARFLALMPYSED